MGRIAVIFNSRSGAQPLRADALKQALAEAGLEADVLAPELEEDLREMAASAVRSGYQMIVAGGGDGTVNAVAAALSSESSAGSASSSPALGILPLGTLNHLAKDLFIPLDLHGAIRNLREGHAMAVDVGDVNGRVFLNMSSVGIYPRIVDLRERRRARFGWPKWFAHGWASLIALWDYALHPIRVEVNGRKFTRRTPNVTVTNGHYVMEGQNFGARHSMTGGCLNLIIASPTGRWGVVKLFLLALIGRLKRAPDLEVITCSEVQVRTHSRHLRVALDGEVVRIDTPLRYRSRPAALRVIVPAGTAERMKER